MAVRDFLNEGGKLIYAGETAGYYGLLGGALGGIYYGLDGAPGGGVRRRRVDPFSDCLLLADDFTQYYLGAFGRTPLERRRRRRHGRRTARRAEAPSAARRPSTTRSTRPARSAVTSDVLPPDEFPQFDQRAGRRVRRPGGPVRRRRGRLRGRLPPRRRQLHAARADVRPDGDRGRRRADVRGPVVVDTSRATTT